MTPHASANLCLTRKGWRNWGQFAADVARLRPMISDHPVLCNLARNRYAFMVGFAAGLLNGQRMLLPSSAAPENVRRTMAGAGEVLILGGGLPELTELRLAEIPVGDAVTDPSNLLDALTRSLGEVHVHTSGSTGDPKPHVKTFGALAGGSNLTENLFVQSGLDTTSGSLTIIGTTPFQHMFGLEAALTTPLVYGHPVIEQTPILPGDLECVLEHARTEGCTEIALVTSPAHLKFLEPVVMASPEIRTVLSATAPMPLALAERLEARGDLAVMEIYGSTETGSLAGRRTVQGPDWTPMNGFALTKASDAWIATAPHLAQPEALADALDVAADGSFRLLGRLGEMVTVAGKRNNLGALNAALAEADGVLSACFVMLKNDAAAESQLGIAAVPGPARAEDLVGLRRDIRNHMRRIVDPVFIPRKIVFTDRIDRDATGKVTAAEQQRLCTLFR